MTDIMTPLQRHRCMSHIRSRNTKPEIKVRQWLWKHGYRFAGGSSASQLLPRHLQY